jgi:5'-deoxynucleotidase YfbR-like HD superfamily hydrolase
MDTAHNGGSGWIQTCTGTVFYPLNPDLDSIKMVDIAHALSNICRYTGHTSSFYSVAQHSVLVSRVVPSEYAMAALVHDGSEAYLCDVARPVKHSPEFLFYRTTEERLQNLIYQRFSVDPDDVDCHQAVKAADDLLLFCERNELMPTPPRRWSGEEKFNQSSIFDIDPLFRPMLPQEAYHAFMDRYAEINSASLETMRAS